MDRPTDGLSLNEKSRRKNLSRMRYLERCKEDASANLKRLLEVSKAICSILELDGLLEVVMEKVLEVTGAERGLIMLYDGQGELQVKVSTNFPPSGDDLKISQSITTQVASTGVPVCASNVLEHDDVRYRKSVVELGLLSVMCVPLIIRNRTLGVIYVDSRKISTLFTANSLRVFSALSEHAAVAIENARLYERAITDEKTGLFNHSHFMRRLAEEVARYKRYRRPFDLLMIDVDHFKAVNDRYGHQAGDKVLIEVASLIRRTVRASDVPARYGGEEFAVILLEPKERDDSPRGMAERLRRMVEQAAVVWEAREIRVTVSIGVAAYQWPGVDTAEELVEIADQRLYRAKNEGRNRVCPGEHTQPEAGALPISPC